MRKIYILLAIASVIGHRSSVAQDIHFSQVTNVPLWLNPAITGFTPGVARIAVQHRNQWFSVTKDGFFKSPFLTTALSFDMPIEIKHDALGVGLFLANDQQGANTFTGIICNASVSYIKTIGREENHRLAAGFQAGYTYQIIKTQDFQFANQFVDNVFQSSIDNNEGITKNRVGYVNLHGGLFWYGKVHNKLGMYVGSSFYNATIPKYNILPNQSNRIYWRWNVHAGMDIILSKKYHILPAAMFTRQGVNRQLNIGLGFGYDFADDKGLTIGCYTRVDDISKGILNDAVFPYVGVNVSGFKIGLSYDATTSKLKNTGSGVGALEIHLSYTVKKRDYNFASSLVCPRF